MGRFRHEDFCKYCAEFVGTFFLCLTVGLNAVDPHFNYGGPLAVGGVLMVMIYALGSISGAHFNPAVTLSVYFAGLWRDEHKLKLDDTILYMVAQLLGGLLGEMLSFGIKDDSHRAAPVEGGYHWPRALATEFLYCALLCFVVLNVACTDKHAGNHYFGMAIGFTVVGSAIAIGGISGCYLNPAVSLGTMITNAIDHERYAHREFKYFPLYFFTPFFSSVVAWLAFYGIRRKTEYVK